MFQRRTRAPLPFAACTSLLFAAIVTEGLVSCTSETTGGGGSPESGSGLAEQVSPDTVILKSIPLDYEVPPSDVLQQISFYLAGGETGCTRNCRLFDDGGLTLYGFDANRSVRLLVYEGTGIWYPCDNVDGVAAAVGRYVTEWEVILDSTGSLRLDVSKDSERWYTFVVLDPVTGELLDKEFPIVGIALIPPGGWPAGSRVRASTSDDVLDVRSAPGYDRRVVASLAHCETATLTGDSELVKGERWWPVRLKDGVEGWVTELWIAPVQ